MSTSEAPVKPAFFEELVLAWLQEHVASSAVAVESVIGRGSDWSGGTECGFYSTFGVEVRYLDSGGRRREIDVEGEDMASLWQYVVGGWRGGQS